MLEEKQGMKSMDSEKLINSIGAARYIKRVEGQWCYFPYSVAIAEYFFRIKGDKKVLESVLEKDARLALYYTPPLASLMVVSHYSIIVLIVFLLCLVFRKRSYVEKYCIVVNCKKPNYAKSIVRTCLYYAAVHKNNRMAYICTFVSFFSFVFFAYLGISKGFIIITSLSVSMALFSGFLFLATLYKRLKLD